MSVWRPAEDNNIDPPACGYQNYIGYQKIINSNNGEIDEQLLNNHIEFMMSDPRWKWEEIPVDFSLLKPGDRVRYTTVSNGKYVFRTGGWVIAVDEHAKWFVYRAHTHSRWSVDSDKCKRIWVIRKKTKPKKVLIFKNPGPVGKYNSYLPDSNGNDVRVGSFTSKYVRDRFENSLKFKKDLAGELWTII